MKVHPLQADHAAIDWCFNANRQLTQLMHVRARMRMHVGSDHVDRRLVTKLIVTYIDRNQDKHTLELMSRMLQFTEVCVSEMCQRCVSGVSAVCVRGVCQGMW